MASADSSISGPVEDAKVESAEAIAAVLQARRALNYGAFAEDFHRFEILVVEA